MSDIQQHVQHAIDQLVESGAERGLQVAVYQNGRLVVDAVAGMADPATGRRVTSDTPFFSYSIGQFMSNAQDTQTVFGVGALAEATRSPIRRVGLRSL